MYAATTSVALVGGDAKAVEVEAHIGRQNEAFKLSGLPDAAMREAKDRVRAAVASAGIRFPNRTVTVNLAPADLPKGGTDYDLPIALAILAAAKEIPPLGKAVVVGELSLSGAVRPAANSLGAGVLSARQGFPCLVASESAAKAASVPGTNVFGVRTLAEAVSLLRQGLESAEPASPGGLPFRGGELDLSEVRGQVIAKRALEVAAAGGHHLLLHGPPGGGKTMLARRLPGILPPLTPEESIEVAMVWASAGRSRGIDRTPPFRSPHHTASRAALVGGGSGIPVPGEVSLGHRGVLCLDELAEFPRGHLDTLRQPLEEGEVTVARSGASMDFSARFQLIGATNPCPCGFKGDLRRPCECRPSAAARYRARVSGPLMDRFDLVVAVGRVGVADYEGPQPESSDAIRQRVVGARAAQEKSGFLNGSAPPGSLGINGDALMLVRSAIESGRLTARGADRVQRTARTIADLDRSERVDEGHLAEALGLRSEWRDD